MQLGERRWSFVPADSSVCGSHIPCTSRVWRWKHNSLPRKHRSSEGHGNCEHWNITICKRYNYIFFCWSYSSHLNWYEQDLDVIETTITELETIRHRGHGGEYLTYQITTLLKAWHHLAGIPRPERPQVPKKTLVLKKLRPPLRISGKLMYMYFSILCVFSDWLGLYVANEFVLWDTRRVTAQIRKLGF